MQCKEKPRGDKYGFTYFARMMNEGKGVAPLSSDSRRRPDRAALEVSSFISIHQHTIFMHSRQPLRISGRSLQKMPFEDLHSVLSRLCASHVLASRAPACARSWYQLSGMAEV